MTERQFKTGATPSAQDENITLIGGLNSGAVKAVAVDSSGNFSVSATIDTTGLATSAKQDTTNTSLSSIDGKITAVNTGAVVVSSSALPSGAANQTKQDTGNTSLASIDGKITAVNTGAVTVASSALPTGAANQTKQDTGNTSLASIDSKITAVNTGAVVVASGSITANAGTNLNTSALSTSANQTTEITSLQLIDDTVHSGDAAVSKYNLIGAVLDDTSPGSVTENQAQSLRMSSRRALYVEHIKNMCPYGLYSDSLNVSFTSSGTAQQEIIAAPGSGNRIVILSLSAAIFDVNTVIDRAVIQKASTTILDVNCYGGNPQIFEFPGGLIGGDNQAINIDPVGNVVWIINITYRIVAI